MKLLGALLVLCLPQDRLPVPDSARIRTAEAQVRETFRAEFAKTAPADKRALMHTLFNNALGTKDDPAARYVLLKEATALAAQVVDVLNGIRLQEQLADDYRVDPFALKAAFLAEAAKSARAPEEHRRLGEGSLVLAAQAMGKDALEIAEQAATLAVAAAKQANHPPLLQRAEARARDVADLRRAVEVRKKHRETLSRSPDDPAANLWLGRQECLARGNWEEGLPFLVKGGDAALRELAARDLARPDDPVALGDAWWGFAEKESLAAKVHARKRAAFWYRSALDRLSGLAKARVEKRIAEAGGEDRSPGLVGYWAFEEMSGTSAADGSGNGGTAALQPGATWGEGVSGGALKLNGAEGFATVPDSPELNFGTDSFTAACFVRFTVSHPYRVVNKWHLEGSRGWMLDVNSQTGGNSNPNEFRGKLRTRIADGSRGVELTVNPKLEPDVWTHIALVMDREARQVRLFANGALMGAQDFQPFGSVSNEAPLGIGRIPPTTGGFFNGSIDSVRLYRRALTTPEILELAVRR